MGIQLTFDDEFDPTSSKGWRAVKVSVLDSQTPIPLARTLAAKKSFDSGFEYTPSADKALFSAKAEGGNAVAIWAAAAFAAAVGGTVEDSQFDITATGATGLAVIAKLAENRAFVAGVTPPEAKTKKKKTGPAKPRALKATVEADPTKPVRAYSASDKFEVGERVTHPSFGEGVVEASSPGKITAFFSGTRRVLVQAKDGGTSVGETNEGLARPTAISHQARGGEQKV